MITNRYLRRVALVLPLVSAACAGCGSTETVKTTSGAPSVHVLSSITDGATLAGAVEWTAHPVGLTRGQSVERVDFLIDGRALWSSRMPPFIFGLEEGSTGERLFPWILGPGDHRFAVRATITGGQVVSSSARAGVEITAPVPHELIGTFTRTVTARDIARTQRIRHEAPDEVLPTGTWRLHIARDGLIDFDDPHGSGGNEAFTAKRSGALGLVGPANWLNPPDRQGSFCGVEPDGAWHWRANRRTVQLIPIRDTCADRNALFGGAWIRR